MSKRSRDLMTNTIDKCACALDFFTPIPKDKKKTIYPLAESRIALLAIPTEEFF